MTTQRTQEALRNIETRKRAITRVSGAAVQSQNTRLQPAGSSGQRDHVQFAPGADRPFVRGLFRIDEAAEWLGLSKRKTYDLVYRGEIPSVYIGRSRRIAFSALETFVDRLPADPI